MGSPEFPTLPWSRATVFDPGGPAEAVAVGFLGIAFRFTNSVGIHSLFSSRGSIPSRCRIAAHDLLVYASPTMLPSLTQHSVPGALPGLPELGLSPSRQSRASLGALAMENFWSLRLESLLLKTSSNHSDLVLNSLNYSISDCF